MSDDLVNRLRREAGTLATMYEAADELERLRAALSSALHALKMDAPHRSEIEEISAAFTWETHT